MRSFPMLVLAAALAGCAATSGTPDAQGWSIPLDGGCDNQTREASAPVLEGGLVYVGGRDGGIYALDAATGTQRWRFQTGTGARHPVTATPALASGSAYVGSWDRRMYSLDAATGKLNWAYDADAPIAAGALVHGDVLLFATHGGLNDPPGRVVALDRRSGREIWSFTERLAKGKLHDRLTLRDGVLYVVTWDAAPYQRAGAETAQTWVRALDAATGTELWVAHVNDAWPSPPAVTSRHVLFMTSPRNDHALTRLRALDRATGRTQWIYEGRGGKDYWQATSTAHQYRPPLVSGERVALFASDLDVTGIDVDSGRGLWRVSEPFARKFLNQYSLGPLLNVVTGDTIAPTVGEFVGIDAATGEVKWRRDMFSRNRVATTIDGNVYLFTVLLGTTLVEIDGRTGEELGTVWRQPLFGNVSYTICAGPSRFGDLLLLSTSRMEFMGQQPSRGYLYAIRVPRR
jgi:outer membrane protein assembly factor BamB